ncbi:hypothetical protein CYY_009083 [Polysphondylium violaceum]|uniref:Proteasome activator PA28 C-terminal domain-containing protein n=1 Tax=Polysphondylium violaceum TaxID=133409 RepID=A0A8J4PM56_9MYCE|nr:hypothetical protein CYY_009083 [Polysphondylium violaceum]
MTQLKIDHRVTEYKNGLYEKAIHHLRVTIPEKIDFFRKHSETYSMGENSLFNTLKKENDGDSQVGKKRKLGISEVSKIPIEDIMNVNADIVQIQSELKKYYMEIIETFSVIRIWISLNIPKIEDGNNFGVDIQENCVNHLNKIEEIYSNQLDQSETYYLNRAAAVKKALKYKDIDGYKYAILQYDEKELMRHQFSYFDLANNYAEAYSLIIKNFQKLQTPKSDHATSTMI